jgi:hypothetical protein
MIRRPLKKAFNTGVSQISHCLLIPAKYHDRPLLFKERVKGVERRKKQNSSDERDTGAGVLLWRADRDWRSRRGRGEAKVDELLETLKYLKHFWGTGEP